MSLCMYVMPDTCLSGTGFGVRFESFSGVQIEAISGVQNEVPTRKCMLRNVLIFGHLDGEMYDYIILNWYAHRATRPQEEASVHIMAGHDALPCS